MKVQPGRITVHPDKEGHSIEELMRDATATNTPIQATAKINYTERGDGVHAEYDIRTDRFEMARQALDKVHATNYASRMQADGFVKNEKTGKWEKPVTPPQGEA